MFDREPIVVTGIGPMCSAARRADELIGFGDRDVTATTGDWFDPAVEIGARGFKYYIPATRLLVAAVRQALSHAGEGTLEDPERVGVVVGTNFAAHETLRSFDDIIATSGADGLSPMLAPNFSINLSASTISLREGFQGFNLTLTTPMVAGIDSVVLATRSLRQGRARCAVSGATEDEPPAGAMACLGLERGQGAACAWFLETRSRARARGAKSLARVGGSWQRFIAPHRLAGKPPFDVKAALDALGPLPSGANGVVPVCALQSDDALARWMTESVVSELRGRGHDPKLCVGPGARGEHATVSALLAASVAVLEHGRALVVSTSPLGHVTLLCLLAEEP